MTSQVTPVLGTRKRSHGPAAPAGGATPVPPSGRQLRLVLGDQEVVVTEVGATLRSYSVAGFPVLDGFGEAELCHGGRGQLLLPWPNRVGDGRYSFGGEEHQLPLDEPELRNAIHGLTRWDCWRPESGSDTHLAMAFQLHARPGYPFPLRFTARYELAPDGLGVSVTALNDGTVAAPFGAGAHPYLRVGTPRIDGCRLHVPASTLLRTDQRMLPAGRAAVAGTDRDFRTPRLVGDCALDTAYTDIERGPDGRARVSLEAPDGRRAVLWFDEAYRWVQLFSGDTASRAEERRRSLAVEPMTCPPDAFRSGEDLIVLEPGQSVTARWGIDVTGLRG